MRRLLRMLGTLLLTLTLVGCIGGDKDKGKNKDAEKPQSGEKKD